MAKQEPARVPDGIRASASGRVPQWVLDEAAGKPVTPVPFRGPTSPPPGGRRPDGRPRRRGARVGGWTLVVLLLAGVVYLGYAGELSGAGPSGVQVAGARTVKPSNGPTPGRDEAQAPLGVPPPVPGQPEGPGYRFMLHQEDGTTPVAWSPCRPITLVTRPDNAPIGGQAMVADAMERLSAATGLTLQDGGFTTEAPSRERKPYQPQRYGDRWAPVLVAWATQEEVPEFGITAAGMASPQPVGTPSGDDAFVSGTVLLDPVAIDQARLALGQAAADLVVLHELGHLLGLDHVADESAVMYPEARATIPDFSAGDRAGLAALGRGACQPDV